MRSYDELHIDSSAQKYSYGDHMHEVRPYMWCSRHQFRVWKRASHRGRLH